MDFFQLQFCLFRSKFSSNFILNVITFIVCGVFCKQSYVEVEFTHILEIAGTVLVEMLCSQQFFLFVVFYRLTCR